MKNVVGMALVYENVVRRRTARTDGPKVRTTLQRHSAYIRSEAK
jgi:hypothetical protein